MVKNVNAHFKTLFLFNNFINLTTITILGEFSTLVIFDGAKTEPKMLSQVLQNDKKIRSYCMSVNLHGFLPSSPFGIAAGLVVGFFVITRAVALFTWGQHTRKDVSKQSKQNNDKQTTFVCIFQKFLSFLYGERLLLSASGLFAFVSYILQKYQSSLLGLCGLFGGKFFTSRTLKLYK